jgi:tRNA(Ile)-lysidine synthetase-like protein
MCSSSAVLLGEVERRLSERRILRRGESRVLVACSGGRDSVVLAHAACALLGARRVVLGHVDHRTRADSHLDAALVERLANELGASFAAAALLPGPSDEARLRRLRYAALEELRRAQGASHILTAHTEDDQAETVLLVLVRSARPSALAGIPFARGRVLRPMLFVPRSEVARYAAAHRLAFRDDPTNFEPRYLRNRIRKELLPLLESRYRANMAKRLARLAARIDRLARLDRATRDVEPPKTSEESPSHAVCAIAFEHRKWTGEAIPDTRQVAIFDADVLQRPVVRLARPGDRIQPFGMDGRRKVRDLLREARVPASQRASFPIVTDERGAVLWVPGAARSSAYPVGPLTRNVWVFWMNDSDKLQGALRGVTVEERDRNE